MKNWKRLNRRTLLRGAGGVAIGLPFLEATMPTRKAYGATPKRFVTYLHLQGTVHDAWTPVGTGSNFRFSEILKPLEPNREKVTILSGIDNNVRKTMGGNGHVPPARSVWSGQSWARSGQHAADGPSIEHVIGGRIQNGAKRRTMHLNIGRLGNLDAMHFSASGVIIQGETDPRKAFSAISAGGGSSPDVGGKPPPPTARQRLQANRPRVLDAVRENFNEVFQAVGKADRVRLEQHADRIEELEKALKLDDSGSGSGPKANPIVSCGSLKQDLPGGFDPNNKNTFNIASTAQNRNAVLALSCGYTNTVSLTHGVGHSPTFAWMNIPGLTGNWHDRVHARGGNNRAGMIKAFTFYTQAFNELITMMNDVDEGDGTLLDNSIALWMSELGDGAAHRTDDIPIVLAGGGGAFKTGHHFNFSGRAHNDVHVTMLNLFGGDETSFGKGGFSKGPLPIT